VAQDYKRKVEEKKAKTV